MRKMLSEIANEVKAGNPLCLPRCANILSNFEDLYCDLVETGEQSGALETIYDRIATYKEKAEALKSKIKKGDVLPHCGMWSWRLWLPLYLLIFRGSSV